MVEFMSERITSDTNHGIRLVKPWSAGDYHWPFVVFMYMYYVTFLAAGGDWYFTDLYTDILLYLYRARVDNYLCVW